MSEPATEPRVKVTITDGIADVRLHRPEKRNALDYAMFDGILGAAEQLANDATVRVVVLSGEGKAFCAGLDTSLLAQMAGEATTADGGFRNLRVDAPKAVRVWTELAVPVIAAVHGVAVGGGIQLALGADFRIVAPDAQLGALEMRWGIIPDMCGTQLLPRVVGPDQAKLLMMTARTISGEEALRIGLATQVADDPYSAAHALARELATRNPDGLVAIKRLVGIAQDTALADGLQHEYDLAGPVIGTANQREAVLANLEGRAPHFS
jgi:enoyl-CoA hydratase/carnithine racemase